MTRSVITASAEDILAATAHELRLPLSHIKGFVSSLRRTDVQWDEQTRLEFIAEIDLETDRPRHPVHIPLRRARRIPPREASTKLVDQETDRCTVVERRSGVRADDFGIQAPAGIKP